MGIGEGQDYSWEPKRTKTKDNGSRSIGGFRSLNSGALHLCIPEKIALQLNLKELYKRKVTTADGKEHLCPYVGPVEARFENRGCFTGALVF